MTCLDSWVPWLNPDTLGTLGQGYDPNPTMDGVLGTASGLVADVPQDWTSYEQVGSWFLGFTRQFANKAVLNPVLLNSIPLPISVDMGRLLSSLNTFRSLGSLVVSTSSIGGTALGLFDAIGAAQEAAGNRGGLSRGDADALAGEELQNVTAPTIRLDSVTLPADFPTPSCSQCFAGCNNTDAISLADSPREECAKACYTICFGDIRPEFEYVLQNGDMITYTPDPLTDGNAALHTTYELLVGFVSQGSGNLFFEEVTPSISTLFTPVATTENLRRGVRWRSCPESTRSRSTSV